MIQERKGSTGVDIENTPLPETSSRRRPAQREFLTAFLEKHFPELQNPDNTETSPLHQGLPLITLCLQKIRNDGFDLDQLRRDADNLVHWWEEDGKTGSVGNSSRKVLSILAAIEPDLAQNYGIFCKSKNDKPALPADEQTITIAAKPSHYLSAAVRHLLDQQANLRQIDKLLEMGRVVQASSGQNKVSQREYVLLLALADRWQVSLESTQGIHSRLKRLLSPRHGVSEEMDIAVAWYLTITKLAANEQPWTIRAWNWQRQRLYNDIRRQILTNVADQYPALFAEYSSPDSLTISPAGAGTPDTAPHDSATLYFTQLYHQHQGEIQNFIQRRTRGDPALAEDLCAEVFWRLWKHLQDRATKITNPRAWLYRTARNLIIDHSRRRRPVPLDGWMEETLAIPGPEASSEHLYGTERLHQALKRLTPQQQQVIALRFLQDLPIRETATMLEMTEGAVKAMTHRAVASLQRQLIKNPDTNTDTDS